MFRTLVIIVVAFMLGFFANHYWHSQESEPVLSPAGLNPSVEQQTIEPELQLPPQAAREQAVDVKNSGGAGFSLASVDYLLINNQPLAAIPLLRAELDKNPASARLWWLLARAYQMTANHREAIASWSNYLRYEVDAEKIDEAKIQFKDYLLKLAANIPADVDAAWLAQQLNDYIQLTMDDPELHLATANLYVAAADSYQAQYHALMAANNPITQARAEIILAQLNGAITTGDMTLPLTRFGNQFLVAVNIEGYPARLLLDTGASITGVSAAYIKKYPAIVKATKPIRLNTASGAIESYLFTVNQLSLGDVVFNQHIIARLPLEVGIEFDGLLGVDLLGRFDFVIDQDEAVLRLGKRR